MNGFYKLLVVSIFAFIWTMPGCGYEWLIREYCSEALKCNPQIYESETACFDILNGQLNSYPTCDMELEDFYACDLDLICGKRQECSLKEQKVRNCTNGFSPYDQYQ